MLTLKIKKKHFFSKNSINFVYLRRCNRTRTRRIEKALRSQVEVLSDDACKFCFTEDETAKYVLN